MHGTMMYMQKPTVKRLFCPVRAMHTATYLMMDLSQTQEEADTIFFLCYLYVQDQGHKIVRTQIPPSKPKRETTEITYIQREHTVKRVSSYFPKGGHSAIQT